MSKEALTWLRNQRIADPRVTWLLNILAYEAKKGSGECERSQGFLAEKSGMSVRTVRSTLAIAERLEIVTRTPRNNGGCGRAADSIKLSLHRNFDVSRGAVQAIRKAVTNASKTPHQPANSAGYKQSRNRQVLPHQPANSAGLYNTVNTEESLPVRNDSSNVEGSSSSNVEGYALHGGCLAQDAPPLSATVIPFPGRVA